ncbi:hypothetical protein AB0G95_21810 [Streptomyces virginiae]|uniref:hypothetical protein n=1 Tax=Streptomyces virginiae TaxID=1961 RepID=UPI003431F5AD
MITAICACDSPIVIQVPTTLDQWRAVSCWECDSEFLPIEPAETAAEQPSAEAKATARRLDNGHRDEGARELAVRLVELGWDKGDGIALGFAGAIYALLNMDVSTVVDIDTDGTTDGLSRIARGLDDVATVLSIRRGAGV